MTCGIYTIKNTINGNQYIGKSVNIEDRFHQHKCELKSGRHRNRHLSNAYNKYGKECFEYEILVECEKNQLPHLEQEWIDKYDPSVLYNHTLYVVNLHNDRNPFFGKKHTEETKIKISELMKGKYVGENNPNYGHKNSVESLVKMSEGRGTLTKDDVLKIVDFLKQGELTHQEIANIFKISRGVITRISSGERWANVTGGPVIPIVYQNGKRQFSEIHKQRIGAKRKGQKHTEESKLKISETRKEKFK